MDINEKKIQTELVTKFDYLRDKVRVQRNKRIFVDVPYEHFNSVLDFCMHSLGLTFLCTISGLDEGTNLSFMYHLTRIDGIVLSLKISIAKENAVIKSVIDRFRGAEIYERELMDLLGVKVEGLPEGKRYPLPDDWPKDQYPLRKDWKGTQNA